MQNKTLNQNHLDARSFKVLYDYYAYLFYLEERRPKEKFTHRTNVLNFFSNNPEQNITKNSYIFQSMFIVGYFSLFNHIDLMKMKAFTTSRVVRVKDLFNDLLFEKKNILSRMYKNRHVGVFESFIRLNYSRGIFLPGACINLSSFYLQFTLYNNVKFSSFSDELNLLIGALFNCAVSLPMKALQYQTLNNMSNESSLVKDYSKIFRISYLMRGFLTRFDFSYKTTLLYLFTENIFGVAIFFTLTKSSYINNLVNYLMDEKDEVPLNFNQEVIADICEKNPTIRRCIYFSQKEKESQKKNVSAITRELVKGISSGLFTGIMVAGYEIGLKLYLGEFREMDKGKIFNLIVLNHKLNTLKFTFQFGLAYSFLRFYQGVESNNIKN